MTTHPAAQQPVSFTPEQALQQGIAHHQAGQLQDAERFYRAILQAQPNHPEANHNLGVLAVQVNQPGVGLPHLKTALESNPGQDQYWLSYINALIQAGQTEAARQVLEQGRQRGLRGAALEELAQRLDNHARKENTPGSQEINALMALFSGGRYAEAAALAQTLTERFPLEGFGWKALGAILQQMGRGAEALEPMQKAAALLGADAEVHNNLGVILKELGRLDEAEAGLRRALQLNPDYANAHNNLGDVLRGLCRLDEAEASLRRALRIKPDIAEAHSNLGNVLYDLGRLDEAQASCRRAVEIKPDLAEAHYNLGNILNELGRLGEAEAGHRRALEIRPDYAEAHNNLGVTLGKLGRHAEAEASHRRALEIKPDFAGAHYNLGIILNEQGRLDEAETCYRRTLAIKPDYAEAHCSLGATLQGLGRLDEAEASLRRALRIKPNFAEAHNNLGAIFNEQGRLDEAEVCYRQALEIMPDYADAHSNLIFILDMADTVDFPEPRRERERWDKTHAASLWRTPAHSHDRSPDRRLRVGYVSADFREHSAPKVFGGMLTRYDRSQFEVFAYSNSKKKDDRFTDSFKQNVTAWRDIGVLADDAAAQMIREDRIDILVDLSGHSAGNRLLVFARKPAPIQITAWGYAHGTGMRAMDVFFADPVVAPPQERQNFSEEIRYLPCVVGSFFTEPFPDVNELPALADGIVSFGSLNRLAKVTEKTYRVWAEVLLAVPRSRLILKTPELSDASVRERVAGYFSNAGVAAERIIMQGKTSWAEHMQACHRIDFGLDPFPHGGGVTALEGLMMGVPVITLRWPTVVGRTSTSIMTTLGLTDWVAETEQHYVELAIRKAADLQSLAALRRKLRSIFTSSVLGDPAAYARAVEQEYRQLWREWCAKN